MMLVRLLLMWIGSRLGKNRAMPQKMPEGLTEASEVHSNVHRVIDFSDPADSNLYLFLLRFSC